MSTRSSPAQVTTGNVPGRKLQSEDHPLPPGGRMRLLIFGCRATDAQQLLQHAADIEVAFLPSYDLTEIVAEITRFKPGLVACSTDFFSSAISRSISSNIPLGAGKTGSHPQRTILPASVTPRETRILTLLIKGRTNKEMAQTLGLSARTIKRTLNGLFERFGASNRTELSNRIAQFLVSDGHI